MADRRSSDHVYEKVDSFKPMPLQAQLEAMQALPPQMVETGWNPRRMQSSARLDELPALSASAEEGNARANLGKKRAWNPLRSLRKIIPTCRADTLYSVLFLVLLAAALALFVTLPIEFSSSEWCGNGVVERGEGCDDGNEDDSDGCSTECVILAGYSCFASTMTLRETMCEFCSQDTYSPDVRVSQVPFVEEGSDKSMLTARVALNECLRCPKNTTTLQIHLRDWEAAAVGNQQVSGCVCTPGSTGPDGGPCQPCRNSTYKPQTGASPCLECPANSLSPEGSARGDACACLPGYEVLFDPAATTSMAPTQTPSPVLDGANASEAPPAGAASADPLRDLIARFECSACSLGWFKSSRASAPCSPCPPGSFSNASGATSCHACPNGTFMPDAGASVCVGCPSPHQVSARGSASVTACKCTAGRFGVDGACECPECPPGTSRDDVGASRCRPCPVGSFANASGRLQCSPCPPGTYQDEEGQAQCKQCPSANHSSLPAASSPAQCFCLPGFLDYPPYACTACPPGYQRPLLSQTRCEACEAGYFAAAGQAACTPCEGGYQNATAQSSCRACPFSQLGTRPGDVPVSPSSCECRAGLQPVPHRSEFVLFEEGGEERQSGNRTLRGVTLAVCELCPAGSAKGLVGDENCTLCALGSFRFQPGATACDLCSVGKTTAAEGSTTPADCVCDLGFGAASCTACGVGKYKDQLGQQQCTSCPEHETTLQTTSTSRDNCTCNPGYTRQGATCSPCEPGFFKDFVGEESCLPCPPGSFAGSTGGGSSCTLCPSGQYSTTNESSNCIRCPDPHHVSLDANGSETTGADRAAQCFCAQGYYGSPGFEPGFEGGQCRACGVGKFNDGLGLRTEEEACMGCGNGTFMPLDGATACIACPNGTFGASRAASACTACPPGWLSVAASGSLNTACDPCPAGTYSPQAAAVSTSVEVERVAPGFPFTLGLFSVAMDVGAVQCLDCDRGTHSPAGSTACLDCERGTFSDGYGTAQCTPCPRNQFQSFAGQTACASCPTSSYPLLEGGFAEVQTVTVGEGNFDGANCICPPGFYGADDQVSCLPCEPGSFKRSPGRERCTLCPAGTAQNSSGASSCEDCAVGTVTNTRWLGGGDWGGGAGKPVCEPCPAAMTTLQVGARAITACVCEAGWVGGWQQVAVGAGYNFSTEQPTCLPCLEGTTQAAGAGTTQESCIECGPGSFAPRFGSPQCFPCPLGTFQNLSRSTACVACAAQHSTAARGAVRESDCRCQLGFEPDPDRRGSCRACGPGEFNAVLGGRCVPCPRGSFNNDTAATACELCGGERLPGQNLSTFQASVGATGCQQCSDPLQTTRLGASAEEECWCPGGWEGSLGGGSLGTCQECDPGRFKPAGRGGACARCAVGEYVDASGATACLECPETTSTRGTGAEGIGECKCVAGLQRSGMGLCEPCPVGTYKDAVDDAKCVRCPGFSNATAPGSSSIDRCLCLPGFSGTAAQGCAPCLPGSFSTGLDPNAACFPCALGFHAPGAAASSCVACNPGTFSDEPGASTCSECAVGSFSPAQGFTACSSCPVGLVAPLTGLANCTPACLAIGTWGSWLFPFPA